MSFALTDIWRTLRVCVEARREAKLRTFVSHIIADCNDGKRQAERLARWERHLNEPNNK